MLLSIGHREGGFHFSLLIANHDFTALNRQEES